MRRPNCSPWLVFAAMTLGACGPGIPPVTSPDPAPSRPVAIADDVSRPAAPPPGFLVVPRLSTTTAPGGCGALDDEFVPTERPMLGGRIALGAPPDALERADRGAVAPPGTLVRESFVYVQRGTEQLTAIARETLGLVPDDLLAYATGHPPRGMDRGELATVTLRGGAPAVVLESTSIDARTGNTPLARVFVAMPEGTLVLVDLVVTSTVEPRSAARCRALARRTLERLSLGTGRLVRTEGDRAIGPLVVAAVPEGYVTEDLSTPDAPSMVFYRPAPLDAPPARLTVTVTRHPPNVATPVDRTSRYLGRNVSWRNLYGDGVERRSAVLRIPGREEYVHSLAEATSLEELEPLITLASRRLAR